MGEAWLELAQAIGRSIGAFWMWRGFDGVDVEMIRERMARVQLQYRIERGDDLLGARDLVDLQVSIGSTAEGPSSLPRTAHPHQRH